MPQFTYLQIIQKKRMKRQRNIKIEIFKIKKYKINYTTKMWLLCVPKKFKYLGHSNI